MSNDTETQDVRMLDLPDGTKVSLEEAAKGYMRTADYTKKTQSLSTERTKVYEEKARLADVQARQNLIDRSPAARAAVDALIQNPESIGQIFGQGRQAPQDSDGYGQPEQPGGQALDPRYDALAHTVGTLVGGIHERERTQAVNAASAIVSAEWNKKTYPFIDEEVVLAGINGSPHLWHMPPSQQVRAIVSAQYGDDIIKHAEQAGYEKRNAELAGERTQQAEQEARADNEPSNLVLEDQTSMQMPSPAELIKLARTDPAKADMVLQAMERIENQGAAARQQAQWDATVNPV